MPMVLTVSNHKRPAQKLRKPDGRAGIPASTRLRRRSNHKLPLANASGINCSELRSPSPTATQAWRLGWNVYTYLLTQLVLRSNHKKPGDERRVFSLTVNY